MKLKLMSTDAQEKGTLDLPDQFKEPVRKDLIKRAVLALQANNRQPYGAFPEAGKRASSYVSKRRRDYKATYGHGQARTPRKSLSTNGSRINWVGATVPNTVGGRRAHPPKPSKDWTQKINASENRKALRSALSATVHTDFVKGRGHRIPSSYPFVLADDFNSFSKTKQLVSALEKLGFTDELERASQVTIRAGKGKMRGRKNKSRKGILFVVSDDCDLLKSARNIKGCDAVRVDQLNAELLAPGTVPGRLTLFTASAINMIKEKKMFSHSYEGETTKKAEKKAEPAKKPVKKAAPKKPAKKVEA